MTIRGITVCILTFALSAERPAFAHTLVVAHRYDACNLGWTFRGFADVVLNDAGQVAFLANLDLPDPNLDTAVYRSGAGCLLLLAKEGSPIPSGNPGEYGFYDDLVALITRSELAINDDGQVAFWTRVKDIPPPQAQTGDAVLLYDGSATKLIARTSQAPPDGNGDYSQFFKFVGLSENGDVIFRALIENYNPLISGQGGVFFANAATAHEVRRFVRVGETISPAAAPIQLFYGNSVTNFNDDGNVAHMALESSGRTVVYYAAGAAGPGPVTRTFRGGDFANWDFSGLYMSGISFDPAVNNFGDVAFTTGVGGGSFSTAPSAIFHNRTSSFAVPVAITDDPSPDGNGTLRDLSQPRINDRNQVAFLATFWNSQLFPDDDSAIFLTVSGIPTIVAREFEDAPHRGTRYDDLRNAEFALNQGGQVAFQSDIAGDLTGKGIFLSDGSETVVIAHTGDMLEGQTITDLEFTGGASRQRTGLNDNGQVAYRAVLDDGSEAVAVTTPDIHWRRDPNSGGQRASDWDYSPNWTVGIQPGAFHDVLLDYPWPLTIINGPQNDVIVKSLVIGDGDNRVTLTIRPGVTLAAYERIDFAALNSLFMTLSGGDPPTSSRLVAGGDVTLQGSLYLRDDPVSKPLAGQKFDLIASLSGALSGSLYYFGPHRVEQSAQRLTVTYMPVAGDTTAVTSFTGCMGGPAGAVAPPSSLTPEGCMAAFDDDGNGHIDLTDYAALDRLITMR